MKIVIAPDKFKGSLSAAEVASAIDRGIRRARPDLPSDATVLCPMADGGEGTASIMVEALGGYRVEVPTHDPLGRPITASIGVVRRNGRKTAIVEAASASGISLLDQSELDPAHASTFGTGEMLRACLSRQEGPLEDLEAVIVTIGGTATTDAGLGALAALGVVLLDAHGRTLGPYDEVLLRTVEVDARMLQPSGFGRDASTDENFVVATDVTNPMVGPSGAAAVFGPQKGIREEEIPRYEEAMVRICQVYHRVFGRDVSHIPGAGAGGGLAGGLVAAYGAVLKDGFSMVADAVGLEYILADADIVITGEGAVDRTSLGGKTIGKIIGMAGRHGVDVAVIAGRIDDPDVLLGAGVKAALSLEQFASDSDESIRNATALLEAAASKLAEDHRLR